MASNVSRALAVLSMLSILAATAARAEQPAGPIVVDSPIASPAIEALRRQASTERERARRAESESQDLLLRVDGAREASKAQEAAANRLVEAGLFGMMIAGGATFVNTPAAVAIFVASFALNAYGSYRHSLPTPMDALRARRDSLERDRREALRRAEAIERQLAIHSGTAGSAAGSNAPRFGSTRSPQPADSTPVGSTRGVGRAR